MNWRDSNGCKVWHGRVLLTSYALQKAPLVLWRWDFRSPAAAGEGLDASRQKTPALKRRVTADRQRNRGCQQSRMGTRRIGITSLEYIAQATILRWI